jgi:hypothetical protein
MLGPKHTAREAAAILVAGLRDGSIVLRHSEQAHPKADYQLRKEPIKLDADAYYTPVRSASEKPTAKKTG